MKKLIQINVTANSGSTGRIAEDIGRLAIAAGWESYIAYGRSMTPSQSKLISIGTKTDLLFHGIQSFLFDRQGLASKKATINLISKIEEIKPNIIHLHNIHGYYLNYKILFHYLSESKIPIVWTLHDCWSITGHCVHFQDINCEKWVIGCDNCPHRNDYPKSLFWDNSKKNYHYKKCYFTSLKNITIIPVCNWLNDILSRSFLQSKTRLTIMNGIDINVFQPHSNRDEIKNKLGIKSNFMLLAVATNWNLNKGLKDIFALNELLDQNSVIVIIGLTKKQIKKLPSNVIGLKKINNAEQLVDLYSAADVFINPTYQDTFPTVNIEALACGTPVITYDTGGAKDAITKEIGFIVDRGDKQGILIALNQIKLLGKNRYITSCRNHAVAFFDKNKRFLDYIKLYEKIIKMQ